MTGASLWPRYAEPADLAAIEAVPLAERGLPESTYALLSRAAGWWPDHPATTVLPEAARWREPVRRTFAELLADVHRYANLLWELGIRRGDAVALMAPNCADLIPATLAAQLAGIAAPLNGGLSRDHLGELLRRSGARVLITAGPELAPEIWDTARTLAAELDVVLVLRPTGAAGEPAALPAIKGVRVGYLADLAAGHDATDFDGEPPVASDLAALFHTGGTTGAPKLAAHTHANEVTDAWMIAANSLLDPGSAVFAALPLFHVNALVVTLLAPLFKGQHAVWAGPLGYREPALYGQFWKIVEHHRIAAMSAVPTVYAVLAQCPVDADIASLRFAMVGASPLPAAVRAGFQTHTGVTLVEGYGLTEATCASARSFPDAPRPGSVGQRMPYQRMKVVHPETGEELPGGETGVLAIGGPTVFPGYVVGRAGNAYVLDGLGKLRDGWLDTGDLARLDADGFVRLAGRVKDLIIRGGHNIDPAMIEDALLSHPDVTAAGAVGRPDEHSGEVPVAYVTLVPGATVTEDELRAWAAGRVPERAAAPKEVTVLDALPVTDVGKPYKLALRADANRRAITEALVAFDGATVDAVIEDGTVVATVTLPSEVDESKVAATLARYTVSTRLTCQGKS
ncbi:acyl-CoA synthetase [Amycolatopsis orientalis]|uniref:acyl-CoA synthetase n=1 Tax=Amycolatopsis orientalis TaxID=31958 RepID=UPI0004292B63|nr:acyl-CoA synthetase [Amycolatopsis orientalis]